MVTRPLRVSIIAVGNGILGLLGMLWAIIASVIVVVTAMGPFEPRIVADACYPVAFGLLWAMLRFAASTSQLVAAGGLYAMRPWSRTLAIGVACFWLFALLVSAVVTPLSLWAMQISGGNHLWIVVAVALGLQLLIRGAWSGFTLSSLLDPHVIKAFEPEANYYAWQPITAPQQQPGEVVATLVAGPAAPAWARGDAAPLASVSNAVQFVVSGPNLPAWQPTDESARHRTTKIAALVSLAIVGLLLIALALSFQAQVGMALFAVVTLARGLFCLGNVWFERRRFFDSRRARGVRWWLGEGGARKYYTAMGAVFVGMSYAISGSTVLIGGVLWVFMMQNLPSVAMLEPDLPGQFDFRLPPPADPQERWKSTKAETAPVASDVVVVQAQPLWRGESATSLASGPEGSLFLLKNDQPLRLWQQDKKEILLLDQQALAGTKVHYAVSAGSQQVLALQQFWHPRPQLRQLVFSMAAPQQPQERSWQNVETPGQGWFVDHLVAAAISDDGKTIAWADTKKHIFVWTADSDQPQQLELTVTDNTRLALSPDGSRLLIGERDGQVRLIERASQRELYQAAVQGEAVQVAFAPNAQYFCSSHVFHTRNAILVWHMEADGTVQHRHNLGNYSAHPLTVFSPDSRRIALGGNHSNMLQVFSLESGQEVIRLVNRDGVNATAFAFTSDGQRVKADGFHMLQWRFPSEKAVQ